MKHLIFTLILTLSLPASAREVTFTWEPFEDVLGYQIYIADSIEFKKIIQKKIAKHPRITTNLEMGTYYYKVRAIDKGKKPGHWSEPLKFIVTPYPPELKLPKHSEVFNYFEIPPQITFKWKKTEGKPVYHIFIYKNNGKKVLEKQTANTELTIDSLKVGEYLWKVKTFYKDIYESPYSEPRRFIVEKDPLENPIMLSPVENATLPSYRKVTLKWDRGDIAEYTDIQVINKKTNKTILDVKNHEDESIDVKFAETGKYKWRIKVKEGKDSEGIASHFEHYELRPDVAAIGNYRLEYGWSYWNLKSVFSSSRLGSPTIRGEVSDSTILTHLRGHYYFNDSYGLKLNLAKGEFEYASTQLPIFKWELLNSFRMAAPGFSQDFYFGFREENIYEFLEPPESYNLFSTYGFTLGSDIQGTITKNWRFILAAMYYKPIGESEEKGDLVADVFRGTLGVSWNPFYKFWVSYRLNYKTIKYNYLSDETQPHLRSKITQTILEPFFLTISLEH